MLDKILDMISKDCDILEIVCFWWKQLVREWIKKVLQLIFYGGQKP